MSKITKNLIIKSSFEAGKDNLENTNGIILPNSILEKILAKKIENYFFKIINKDLGIYTYVSVQEYSEDEDSVIVPYWIYEYLAASPETVVEVQLEKNIIKGKKIVLEPQEKEFFKIPESDVILESVLSKFSVLHYGSIIKVNILDKKYTIKIADVEHDYNSILNNSGEIDNKKMNNMNIEAIDIINVDLNVELRDKFLIKELEEKRLLEEKRKKELEEKRKKELKEKNNKDKFVFSNFKNSDEQSKQNNSNDVGFVPFSGKGHRLGGD